MERPRGPACCCGSERAEGQCQEDPLRNAALSGEGGWEWRECSPADALLFAPRGPQGPRQASDLRNRQVMHVIVMAALGNMHRAGWGVRESPWGCAVRRVALPPPGVRRGKEPTSLLTVTPAPGSVLHVGDICPLSFVEGGNVLGLSEYMWHVGMTKSLAEAELGTPPPAAHLPWSQGIAGVGSQEKAGTTIPFASVWSSDTLQGPYRVGASTFVLPSQSDRQAWLGHHGAAPYDCPLSPILQTPPCPLHMRHPQEPYANVMFLSMLLHFQGMLSAGTSFQNFWPQRENSRRF